MPTQNRAIGKMEREMEKAERRAERKVVIRTAAAKAKPPKPPKPLKPPPTIATGNEL